MRSWLDSVLPGGAIHAWLVGAGEAGLKLLLVGAAYFTTRWLTLRGLDALLAPLVARSRRDGSTGLTRLETLQGITRSAVTYVLLLVALITLLGQIGVNITALLTGAGVAGLAVSFGAQRIVRDVLTGFFLLLEDQFRVGELVTLIGSPGLPQLNGTVLEMGLRLTRLRDIHGKMVSIGNGDIVAVVNHSRGPVLATVELGIPADTSIDRVRTLVAEIPLSEALFTGSAELEGMTALESDRMVLRIAAPAVPGRAPAAELALRQAVGEALRGAEIEIR